MRLTLRTLLAHLDDILDPADREELTKKIETSGFANDLIHRTRDTMRRLRLSAPQPLGTGMALDPNTVAEYLDNVLSPDAVGDFERICLESDVHLAEVASCHHVLTMVLGEPAAVDPDTKQRMYAVATEIEQGKRLRVEPAHISPPAAGADPAANTMGPLAKMAGPGPAAKPPAATVPDYLRTSAWARTRGILLLAASALLVCATIYFALGLTGWFASEPQTIAAGNMAAQPLSVEESARPEMSSADLADRGTTPSPTVSTPPPPLTPGFATQPEETSPQPAESMDASLSAEPAAPLATDSPYLVQPETPETPDRYGESSAGDAPPEGEAPPPLRLPASPMPEQKPAAALEPQALEPPEVPTDRGLRVASAMDDTPAVTTPASDFESDVEAAMAVPEMDPKLGTYLGGKNVLLRFDEEQKAWFRSKPRTAVNEGDKLLALPVYRPRITLASGVYLEMVGGTQIRLSTAGANNDVPRIEIVYGRVVLVNVDAATEANRLQLAFGTTVGDVQLAPNATLAVDVERVYVPGQDPRRAPAPVVASLFAPNGHIVWTDDLGARTVDEPGRWTVSDGVPAAISVDGVSPEWIDRDPVEFLSEQRHGAPVIEQSLVSDRPIDNQLLELYQGSGRREVKSLAARCSVHVGQFVPFVEALRDSDQKAVWKIHIETLRSAMALSPESAESIWKTLVDQRGERAAADLYEMLCGYDSDQIGQTQREIEVGAIAHLIDRLEDDNLDYRVLAVHNLREITGKTLMANPAGSPNEREQGIRHWRSRLKAGELGPKTQP